MNPFLFSTVVNTRDFFTQFLSAQAPYGWEWRMPPMWAWGWGVVMMAMMLLVSGVVIFAGAMAIRWFFGQNQQSRSDSALEILEKRFARGEIDKDEFEAKKKSIIVSESAARAA